MNFKLMEEIIKNVYSNFLIIQSEYIKNDLSKKIISNEFLLSDKLIFNIDDDNKQNDIWGCQSNYNNEEIKILLSNCSIEKDVLEFCMVIQLKESITYGLYLTLNYADNKYSDPMIACSLDANNWSVCNTYLQATFLAGMEYLKDLCLDWTKCDNYSTQLSAMKSFIKYYDSFYNLEK